jgi:small subunit ribosomal protein S17
MRSKTGLVTSAKGDKTIVVKVDTYKAHAKYKKRYRVSTKFHAHDPNNEYKEHDTVTIYESRPISKMKRWTVVEPTAKTDKKA